MFRNWNPHVEQLREAGWANPQKIYQMLVETPDPLGRSVGRMVDIFCEAMERARKNVDDAREAARAAERPVSGAISAYGVSTQVFAGDSGADIVRRHPERFKVDDQGRLACLEPRALPSALELLTYSAAPPREYEARPRSKSGQRAAERKAKGWR